jgi:hypothetical protein
VVLGERLPGAATIAKVARAFARLGLRRSLLVIQYIEHQGRFLPIDFNVRIGALFDRLDWVKRLGFYESALRFLLGYADQIRFSWPAPRVGIHRMYLPNKPGRWTVDFGKGCIPLVNRVSYDPKKPYDFGYAWPGFAVLAPNRRIALEQIARVRRQAVVQQLA